MASYETFLFARDLRSYRNVDETRRKYSLESDTDAAGRYDVTLLSWLWTSCVAPIFNEIADLPDFTSFTQTPRVWWIGTGVASSLLFHAAGKYPYSQKDALTRTISSYTPAIKSLVYA